MATKTRKASNALHTVTCMRCGRVTLHSDGSVEFHPYASPRTHLHALIRTAHRKMLQQSININKVTHGSMNLCGGCTFHESPSSAMEESANTRKSLIK